MGNLETQIVYYTYYILKDPNQSLVKVYADKGASGTNTEHRAEFQRLIIVERDKTVKDIKLKLIEGMSPYKIANLFSYPLMLVRGIREQGWYKNITVEGYIDWENKNPVRRLKEHLSSDTVKEIKRLIVNGKSLESISASLEIEFERVYKIDRGFIYSNIIVDGFEPRSIITDWVDEKRVPSRRDGTRLSFYT